MFGFLKNLACLAAEATDTKDRIADTLRTTPAALEAFEKAYQCQVLSSDTWNAKDQKKENHKDAPTEHCLEGIIQRIVDGLLTQTASITVKSGNVYMTHPLCDPGHKPVTPEEVGCIPENIRPQLTDCTYISHVKTPSCGALLTGYRQYLEEKDPKRKQWLYGHFRQGLDILDLDPVTWLMLGQNPDSMGKWLPQITEAAKEEEFFKIPDTTVATVPLPILQMSRMDYGLLNKTTLEIIDRWAFSAFGLDGEKEYFVKTGTYSSKFDFRNARVSGPEEVRTLGEYLLFIQNDASMKAGPLAEPSIYGMSTTNEWCVRDFIPDREGLPTIYKGLPLRTEFRLFVDFDSKEILGISPYWEPGLMKQRFGHMEDKDDPHNVHDYCTYKAREDALMKEYTENIPEVLSHAENLIRFTEGLTGQWSLDIMKNEENFWLIDMALAKHSALKECVPEGKLKAVKENWIPEIPEA